MKKKKSRKGVEKSKEIRNVEYSTIGCKVASHSSSFLESTEWKAYNVKIQFTHIIIQDIDTTKTFTIEFLLRSR